MRKSLILSLETKRTLRVHEGLKGAFAFEEQLCGLENLRLWQDDAGDVLAMIHFSAQVRDGYLAFPIGSASRRRLHFRNDGHKCVRIKGLEVANSDYQQQQQEQEQEDEPESPKRGKGGKGKAEKKITAVKIEFLAEEDKKVFLDKLRELQG